MHDCYYLNNVTDITAHCLRQISLTAARISAVRMAEGLAVGDGVTDLTRDIAECSRRHSNKHRRR